MYLIILIAATAGYWWGRRAGYTQGMQYGQRQAIFSLKSQSWQGTYCSLCGRGYEQDSRETITKETVEQNDREDQQ